MTEADQPEALTEKARAGLRQVELDPEEYAPYILHLLGVREGTDRLAALSPEEVKSRSFERLRQLCLKGSRPRPLILVLEDLHCTDKTKVISQLQLSLGRTIGRLVVSQQGGPVVATQPGPGPDVVLRPRRPLPPPL